ncbi:hypothetical protein [Zhongshania aliphaticivorans]|uniref:hypothetical protein n=1 Tax=Zhongshania aliphaticivorans TaxID=1470434 RepID=UPI0012E522BB|nr:hypothetical protein [Zhongshania aliphaticivorans]CAA0084075.1 Uncharacterised protein [Zhongshania aliphaticivorans]
MTEHIDDWLKRLADPAACETEKERAVMNAVRSGLRAAEPATQIDQLALQRLHKRLASEGVYDAAIARSRRFHVFGYAAVLLLGVSIILNYAVTDKPLHEAALQLSEESATKRESYSKQIQAANDELAVDEREMTQFSDSSIVDEAVAQMASRAKQEMSVSASPEQYGRADSGSEFDADSVASKPRTLKYLNSPIELRLTATQWQALSELNHEGISLSESEAEGVWVLILNSESSKARWINALPKPYKMESWPLNTEIEIQLVSADD